MTIEKIDETTVKETIDQVREYKKENLEAEKIKVDAQIEGLLKHQTQLDALLAIFK